MSSSILQGKVSFVNHDKKYVMIEFLVNGKKKNINGPIDDKTQQEWINNKIIKKIHHFHIGDTVNFISRLSPRGDKMVALNIQFKYNESLDVLINKSFTENNFTGYLKEVDGKLFVKEIDSYLFFPVPTSVWALKPTEQDLNEAVTFSLENTENKEKVYAKLYNNKYIPEFYTAVKLQKSKTIIDASIFKITEHGIYLNIIGDKITSKMPLNKNKINKEYKIGDILKIQITHIGDTRIVVNEVES